MIEGRWSVYLHTLTIAHTYTHVQSRHTGDQSHIRLYDKEAFESVQPFFMTMFICMWNYAEFTFKHDVGNTADKSHIRLYDEEAFESVQQFFL